MSSFKENLISKLEHEVSSLREAMSFMLRYGMNEEADKLQATIDEVVETVNLLSYWEIR